MWTVKLLGEAVPKGSMRCLGRGSRPSRKTGQTIHQLVPNNDKALAAYVPGVIEAGALVLARIGHRLEGPLGVDLTFTMTRPASVPQTKRWDPTVPPDVDKLSRTILDALTQSGVWRDDAQVVDLAARKTYPNNPDCPTSLETAGTLIQIWEMTHEDPTHDQPSLELEEPRLPALSAAGRPDA